MRDVILADASNYGVDLAVSNIFTSYQPGIHRWEQLQYPNNRWLTCETDATVGKVSKTVHIDLIDGQLRVSGQPLGHLPLEIGGSSEFYRISCNVRNVEGSDINKRS